MHNGFGRKKGFIESILPTVGTKNDKTKLLSTFGRNFVPRYVIPSIFCGFKGFIIFLLASLYIIPSTASFAKEKIAFKISETDKNRKRLDSARLRFRSTFSVLLQSTLPFLEVLIMIVAMIFIHMNRQTINPYFFPFIPIICLLAMFTFCFSLRMFYLFALRKQRVCPTSLIHFPLYDQRYMNLLDDCKNQNIFVPNCANITAIKEDQLNEESNSFSDVLRRNVVAFLKLPINVIKLVVFTVLTLISFLETVLYGCYYCSLLLISQFYPNDCVKSSLQEARQILISKFRECLHFILGSGIALQEIVNGIPIAGIITSGISLRFESNGIGLVNVAQWVKAPDVSCCSSDSGCSSPDSSCASASSDVFRDKEHEAHCTEGKFSGKCRSSK